MNIEPTVAYAQADVQMANQLEVVKNPARDPKHVSQEFESIFLHQLLKEFDKTIDRSESLLYAGQAEDMYRNMFYQELAKSMSANGGIGLAELVEKDITE